MDLRPGPDDQGGVVNFRILILDFRLQGRTRTPPRTEAAKSRIESQKSGIPHAFTLVEVLMALVIFALAAVVLGSAYLNVLNSYEAVSRSMQAGEDVAYARQLVLTEPDREKLELGGEFEAAGGRQARWSAAIEPTTMADLFTVTFACEVSDPARPEPEKVVQTFTLFRPTWSIDPAERSRLKEETRTRILELQGRLAR
jgi:general secretion pathway protein I